MSTWSEQLAIFSRQVQEKGKPNWDGVRREYLTKLNHKTGRDVILYATKWTVPGADPQDVSIVEEDIQGFMEVFYGLKGPKLDIILHSPGGSPEVTEALVTYIRSKFSDVRVFVPHAAMSAATMFACAANIIVIGKQSSLGPIDPQFIIRTESGPMMVAAQAILDQFDRAKEECADPRNIGPWMPILKQYGPALLTQCENAIKLSQTLVKEWLEKYMFAGDPSAEEMADQIAKKLSDHKDFKSHGRRIMLARAKDMGLKIEMLEQDQELQDLVLSVYHAVTHAFSGPAVKIIENHQGRAFIKVKQQLHIQVPTKQGHPQQPRK